MEALVLKSPWRDLFTDAELAIAKKRLDDLAHGPADLPAGFPTRLPSVFEFVRQPLTIVAGEHRSIEYTRQNISLSAESVNGTHHQVVAAWISETRCRDFHGQASVIL